MTKQIPIIKNNTTLEATIWKIINLLFAFCLVFSISCLVFAPPARAQTLGLSISPPIDEIMIIPGKSVTQTFTITNDGNDGNASVYILPFKPEGESGDIFLDEKNPVTTSLMYSPWFSILSPVTGFGQKFYLPRGKSTDVTIKISPSANAAE